MIALIEYVGAARGKKRLQLYDEEPLGMRAVRISLPRISGRKGERLLLGAAAVLERLRIKTVCFAEEFDRRGFFLELGFREPDKRRLLAAKSSEIVLAACGELRSVAVISGMIDDAAVTALNTACSHFRWLMVDVGIETGRICAELRRKTGISVLEMPGRPALRHADAAIIFRGAGERCFGAICVVFCADRDARQQISGGRLLEKIEFSVPVNAGRLPAGYDRVQLMAAAFDEKQIKAEELSVLSAVF